jgi:O-antigen ligase
MATQPEQPDPSTDRTAIIEWLTVVLAFSLSLYRPWLTLAATLVMLFWFFGGDLRSRLVRLRHHRLTLAILVFLALNLASLAWSSDPMAGLRYVTKYRYLLLVPMLATAIPLLFRSRTAIAFQIGAVTSVALSLTVALGGLHIGDAYPGNPSATMAHLDYTLILAVASLLALTRALYARVARSERILWFAAFAVSAAGLLFNIGRSGQLGFCVGLAVLLLRWAFDSSTRLFTATLALVVVGSAVVVALAPPAFERMRDAREELRTALVDSDFESNIGGRLAAVKVAVRIVREEPLLGTGVGGNMPRFRQVLDNEYQELKPAIYWYRHFHNQYAQTASELGLAGLAALAWIFWALVRGPYRSREIASSAWVLATVYLVAFLGEPFFHKQVPLIAFGLVAGLISAAQLDEIEEAPVD